MMFTAGLIHALPPSDRRCFDRKEAASYVCVSVGTFDRLVEKGELPGPLLLLGRKVWDKRSLDRALDEMSGLETASAPGQAFAPMTTETPLDVWRRANAEN
ncbi:hypothetical protein [Oricola indica]|jgi:predicted DNA-binding transcriptional regulator AlpA|uniref:hypothetical protein n=1 Tax=Oricola indica TaxID=2872591 RepID=UPI001CC07081|nr:hypothetical protein [Oricola indica]